MENLFYAGVVAFGAFTLVIEARRNYNVSARHHPFDHYSILKSLQARNLCSPRDWEYGLYVYSLLYLITYAILLSSSELAELIYTSKAAEKLVGATGIGLAPENDPFGISGTDYAKPLFLSAAIITFYSMGATRNIELHIRTLAHRLAGVPRGVNQVLQRLQMPEFLPRTQPQTGPLMAKFRHRLKDLLETDFASATRDLKKTDPDYKRHAAEHARQLMRLDEIIERPLSLAAVKADQKADARLSEPDRVRRKRGKTGSAATDARPRGKNQYVEEIAKALRVIDMLRPAVTGGQRATHFPLLGLSGLEDISDTLEDDIGKPDRKRLKNEESPRTLHDELNEFSKYDEANLERLRAKAIEVANSARAVFAVYFISNSRTVLNAESGSPLERAARFSDHGFRAEQNAITGALFFAILISAPLLFSIATSFYKAEAWQYPNFMAEEIHSKLERDGEEPGLTYRQCRDYIYKPESRNKVQKPEIDDDNFGQRCARAREDALPDYIGHRRDGDMSLIFFTTLTLFLTTGAVAFMAIFERDARLDQNAWRSWTLRRIPYARFLVGAILPAIIGGLAVCLGYMLRLMWNKKFDFTVSEIEFLFVSQWLFFLSFVVPCFFLCIAIFVLIDKHDQWHWPFVMLFACLAAATYVAAVWFVPAATQSYPSDLAPSCTADWAKWVNWMPWVDIAVSAEQEPRPAHPEDTCLSWITSDRWGDVISLSLFPVVFLLSFAFILKLSRAPSPKTEHGQIENSGGTKAGQTMDSGKTAKDPEPGVPEQ